MVTSLHRKTQVLLFHAATVMMFATQVRAAWLPWDRPIRRSIDASSKEDFAAALEKLRPDLDKEVYSHLINSLAWLGYYHGAKLRLVGVRDPDRAMKNMLTQIHKKSAFDIIMLAEDLSERESAVFGEYKLALKLAKP